MRPDLCGELGGGVPGQAGGGVWAERGEDGGTLVLGSRLLPDTLPVAPQLPVLLVRQVLLQLLPLLVVSNDFHPSSKTMLSIKVFFLPWITCFPHIYLYCRPHNDVGESLDGGGEVQLAAGPLFDLHLEADEPVTANLVASLHQTSVGLGPHVGEADGLPLEVGHQVPHLALHQTLPR